MNSDKSFDEKLRLLNGKDFWTTYSSKEFKIKEIVFSDGPTGLRYQTGENDHLGMNSSKKATCFPTPSAMSCTFDTELMEEVARCIAGEAAAENVDVVLGPGVNIKRSPLCGRNFEYYSEDPYLTKEMGEAFVNGLQKNGIGASLKHFAANNQEAYRMSVNVVMDDRALYEIYLKAFEDIIREAEPWTIMSAYNKLSGYHCSENRWLLKDLLRSKFNFDGLVISDWYAVNDIISSINNGLDLEMPGTEDLSLNRLKEAFEKGILDPKEVERAVRHLSELSYKCSNNIKKSIRSVDYGAHHKVAQTAAAEAVVLLKNNMKSLPLSKNDKLLFVGELMNAPVIQGNGSSRVNPVKVDSIHEALEDSGIKYAFAAGYSLDTDELHDSLINSAVKASENADKVIVFAGLPDFMEAESYDRENLNLPKSQDYLIDALSKTGKEIIVVLQTGSAVVMPWEDKVNSIIQMHLSGEASGTAIVEILFGKANPCGRLTETYPKKLSDIPSFLYKGTSDEVKYNESIFVGYRYYDKKEMDVLFPFGFGLSYSEFKYSGFKAVHHGDEILISLKVKNLGPYDGKETVQVYTCLNENQVVQPVRKLSAFKKIFLRNNEEKEIHFKLSEDDFKYYDICQCEWVYASGTNKVEIGRSSRHIEHAQIIEIEKDNKKYSSITTNTTVGELFSIPLLSDIVKEQMDTLIQGYNYGDDVVNKREFERSIFYMPLRNIVQITSGGFSSENLEGFINYLNGILEGKGVLIVK